MANSKYKHGEWLGLRCDGNFNFIKGHVSEKEAVKIANKALQEERFDESIRITDFKIKHQVARFGIGYDECGERWSHLYINRPEGERGSFPITEIEYTLNLYKEE